MDARLTIVGLTRWVGRNVVANPFELSAPNIFQVLPLGRCGCRLVQVDRDLITLPYLFAYVPRHGYAVFNAQAFDWNEGNNLGCTHAWMRSLMFSEIDQLSGFTHASNGRFLDGLALADQCNDATVVIGIHLAIEQVHTINFHGVDDGVNLGFVAPFRKIGNTFHQRRHNVEEYRQDERAATRRVRPTRQLKAHSAQGIDPGGFDLRRQRFQSLKEHEHVGNLVGADGDRTQPLPPAFDLKIAADDFRLLNLRNRDGRFLFPDNLGCRERHVAELNGLPMLKARLRSFDRRRHNSGQYHPDRLFCILEVRGDLEVLAIGADQVQHQIGLRRFAPHRDQSTNEAKVGVDVDGNHTISGLLNLCPRYFLNTEGRFTPYSVVVDRQNI